MSHLDICILALLALFILLVWHYVRTLEEENEPLKLKDEAAYLNSYHCNNCDITWHDVWSSQCDDECSGCNKAYSPFNSEELSCRLAHK